MENLGYQALTERDCMASDATGQLENFLAREEEPLRRVEAFIDALIGTKPPLGKILREHMRSGGKRIRARLALASTRALGGRSENAIPWAAACELLHNATLIHDDLQDGDRQRRGHPTTWVKYGAAQSINAGDLMLMLPFIAIDKSDVSPARRAALSAILGHAAATTVHGQAMEQELGQCPADKLYGAYMAAIAGKTSALFALPVEGSCVVSGREADAQRLTAPFQKLGLIFQMQDDVLDLYGEKGRNVTGADIREGKFSTLVVQHLELCPSDRNWLLQILRAPREETSDRDVDEAIARFRESALPRVLVKMQELEDHILTHTALQDEPGLFKIASGFIELVSRPISHLR